MTSRLANSVVLVIGATGNIGSSAVASYLNHGATVIAPSRTQESLDKLHQFLTKFSVPVTKLTTVPNVNVSDGKDAEKLAGLIQQKFNGKLDHVVCSSGPWWNTPPLHQMDVETYRKALASNVDAHFLMWRYIGPLVVNQPNSSFTFINGRAASLPQVGFTSFLAHSVEGLAAVVNNQTKSLPVRTNELMINVRVESDKDFEEKKMTATESLSKSSAFGDIFPAIAVSNVKSQTINVETMTQWNEFVKANPVVV
ncbi:Outer membrane efflux protein [Blyttiomyces sp. JEL0837]|nr:Outer membrane efflux protein [Blyttiomyces sp. JEL0837]